VTDFWLIAFLIQGLRISIPYVLCAIGGTVSERSGVIQLGLEGMLLGGAFTATVAAHVTGVPAAGVLGGVLGGVFLAGIFAAVTLWGRADQVVAGVALNMLAIGLTRYFLKLVFDSASSTPPVPGIGGGWEVAVFIVGTAGLALLTQVWLTRTPSGLRTWAVGENPLAAEGLGVVVRAVRLRALLVSGALAGLGGAWLALDNHGFVDRMSGGRGYIAVAAVILGRWRPGFAAAACLFFGFADALQVQLQTRLTGVPRELLQILPYVATLVVLTGFVGRAKQPAALGR
jgi:general nucleoside transport system permease protein